MSQGEPIAVVGMGCRFADSAHSPDDFWRMLREGVDATTAGAADGRLSGGAYLDDVFGFDADFFGIAERKAMAMDPAHRHLLEVVWEALENGGIDAHGLPGTRCAVYVGPRSDGVASALGLEGPAITVNVASSSALETLHLACKALKSGEADLALAGGANGHLIRQVEGVGIVVLKRQADAARDGDRILVLINGSAIDEAPTQSEPEPVGVERPVHVITASAHTPAALRELAGNLSRHIEDSDLANQAYTANTGRAHLSHRVAVVATDGDQARAGLTAVAEGKHVAKPPARDPELVFLFSGQGTQYPGMGRQIYETWPVFRDAMDQCAALCEPSLQTGLLEVMQSPQIRQTGNAQPTLFALEYALASLWRSWGITPDAVVGHSLGELAAACVAGVFSLEDGLRLVCARGRLMQSMPPGSMAAIQAPEARVLDMLSGRAGVEIAAVNTPNSTVVTGTHEAVDRLLMALESTGVTAVPLMVSHGFHSASMEPILDAFEAVAATVAFSPPTTKLLSTLTGKAETTLFTEPSYWRDQLRQTVRFAATVQALRADGCDRFLEIGPRPVLLGMAAKSYGTAPAEWLASLRPGTPDAVQLVQSLGALYEAGFAVDWQGFDEPWNRRKVALPTYPWQRRDDERPSSVSGHPLLGLPLPMAGPATVFASELSVRSHPWLADHRLNDEAVVPAAVILELLRAAAEHALGSSAVAGLVLRAPMVVGEGLEVQVVVAEDGAGSVFARPLADADAPWAEHATAVLSQHAAAADIIDLAAARERCSTSVPVDEIYQSMAQAGVSHGPAFRNLVEIWRGPEEIVARIALTDPAAAVGYGLAPTLIDACLQALAGAVAPGREGAAIPFEFGRVTVAQPSVSAATVHARLIDGVADVVLVDDSGALIARLEGLRLRVPAQPEVGVSYRVDWQEAEAVAPQPVAAQDWVVVAADEGAVAVANGLRGSGARCTVVASEALQSSPAADHWVCLWTASDPVDALATAKKAVAVLQAALGADPPPRIWWVAVGSSLASAPLAGLARTARLEHPELECTLVQVDSIEEVSQVLLRELACGDAEREVIWRKGARLVPRLVRETTPFRSMSATDGAVLITGGFGELGLQVARLLAVRGVEHLVLLGRRGAETPGAEEAIAELQRLGATVTAVAADVADPGTLPSVIARLGDVPLRGIVHAAGVIDDGVLATLSGDRLDAVMAPKVVGAWQLHVASCDLDLDFFVLFSSLASVLGSPGQGAYAAGNAFLDALAGYRVAAGLTGLSLSWGAWQGGMSASLSAAQRARIKNRGILPLTDDEGLALFEAMAAEQGHRVVMRIDRDRVARAFDGRIPPLWNRVIRAAKPSQPGWTTTVAQLPAADRMRAMRQLVREEVALALSSPAADSVPVDQALMELGFDSLLGIELRNALSLRIGARLPATLVFDYPDVEAISGFLLEHIGLLAAASVASDARRLDADEPIAIVGMACRFPGGADSPDALWQLLQDGVDATSEIPPSRWDVDAYYDPEPGTPGKMYVRRGAFVDDLSGLDAAFFNISGAEARELDPQHRMLLEVSWEAIERAGWRPSDLAGSRTGVFFGVASAEYGTRFDLQTVDSPHVVPGNDMAFAAGRVAHFLELRGPALVVNTVCSSSLVALHQACSALRSGECDKALVGGVNALVDPAVTVFICQMQALAADGRCKPFDASADGYGRGEGCGIVAIRRLSDALADGDRVLAVVRGTAVNHDGRSSGLTAPSGRAQQEVIRSALANSGVAASEVGYLECHGTGTSLGDPIEVRAAGTVYGAGRPRSAPLPLGAIKANIGHLEGASGIAGLIKLVLTLEREEIPGNALLNEINLELPLEDFPVWIPRESIPWKRGSKRRVGAVSAFGLSGTNAHAVVEEGPQPTSTEAVRPSELLVVSAKSEAALKERVAALASLAAEVPLGALAFSLATTREHHAHRAALVLQQGEDPGAIDSDAIAALLGSWGLSESAIATARAKSSELTRSSALTALGDWYCGGGQVDWAAVFPTGGVRIPLPTYPWQRQRYWVDRAPASPERGEWTGHGLLGFRLPVAGGLSVFSSSLSISSHPWLADHEVSGEVLVPAAAILEILRAGAEHALRATAVVDVVLHAPMFLGDGVAVQVVIAADGSSSLYFRPSGSVAEWTLCATAEVASHSRSPVPVDLAAIVAVCTTQISIAETYVDLADSGLSYGPAFRALTALSVGDNQVLAQLELPDSAAVSRGLAPVLVDGALQAIVGLRTKGSRPELPFSFARFEVFQAGARSAFAHVANRVDGLVDIQLANAAGQVIAAITGVRTRPAAQPGPQLRDAEFVLAWREAAIPAVTALPERWVVVEGPQAEQIAEGLRAAGQQATVASAVDALETPADHLVRVWSEEATEQATRVAAHGLEMTQALVSLPRAPRTWWLTFGSVATSPLWGFGRSAVLEHPDLELTLVDVGQSGDIADLLLRESTVRGEGQISWRQGRAVRRLVRAQPAPAVDGPAIAGTVLITGGLGVLGLEVAASWVARGARHLVLVGRRGIDTPGAAAAVEELRAAGAKVAIEAVDVTDREALHAALERIDPDVPLRSVIHAAGVLDDGLLEELSAERLAAVLAPKVTGAWNLHTLTTDLDLTAFVLFSSLAGMMGSAGQSAYAGANAFLDALAAHRRSLGLVAHSLAWGPWDVGMTEAVSEDVRARYRRMGLRPLPSAGGLELLHRSIARTEAELGLFRLDLEAVARGFGGVIPALWSELLSAPAPAPALGGWARDLSALPAAERLDAVRAAVRIEVAPLLALSDPEAVPMDQPLQEVGLDSLLSIELRNALGRLVGLRLPATVAFDHPTADGLARFLAERLGLADAAPVWQRGAAISGDPIAIVGIGCRFPGGGDSPDAFFAFLKSGGVAAREVPAERWDVDAWYDPVPATPGKMYVRKGSFLDDIEMFDAPFFGIGEAEATAMDPQQRLLLEVSSDALERAGWPAPHLEGSATGVFVGISSADYSDRLSLDSGVGVPYLAGGNDMSFAAGRLAHSLGLRGPAVVVNTACSSSLVALHQACSALRAGECDRALAGGVSALLSPEPSVLLSQMQALAPDGRCKTFDAAADGYGRGEGCGMLALRRLSDAERDGDPVLAVIRGSAVNHDGRSSGLTVPSGTAQQEVIRSALADAGVSASEVSYLECHGTGTALGDPIEVRAAATVYSVDRDESGKLALGAVKANIGHLEAAAGVAGLIKLALALEREEIPGNAHLRELNPDLPMSEFPISVSRDAIPWNRGGRRRVGAVSSFGLSGTNAHVVLEEAPSRPSRAFGGRAAEILVVSAKSEEALAARLSALSSLAAETSTSALAYSLATARAHYAHRAAVVVHGSADVAVALSAVAPPEAPAAVWWFSGDESANTGRELYEAFPIYRERFDEVLQALDSTANAKNFAMHVAMDALLRSWGLAPASVAGAGVGRVSLDYLSGRLSLADASLRIDQSVQDDSPPTVPMLEIGPATADLTGVFGALAAAYTGGAAIDWSAVFPDGGERIPLPTYPWQRRRYWSEPARRSVTEGAFTGHDLLGHRLALAGPSVVFSSELSLRSHVWLGDHRLSGEVVVPAAAILELLRAAAEHTLGSAAVAVFGTVLQAPMVLSEALAVQVVVSESGAASVYARSARDASPWRLHATARLELHDGAPTPVDLRAAKRRCAEAVSVEDAYAALESAGLAYGSAFRGVRDLWRGEGEVLAALELPNDLAPTLLDAAFQATSALEGADGIPFEFGQFRAYLSGHTAASALITRRAKGSADLVLVSTDGRVIAEVEGMVARAAGAPSDLYHLAWDSLPVPDPGSVNGQRWVVVAGDSAGALDTALREAGAICEIREPAELDTVKADHVVAMWDGDGAADAIRNAQEGLAMLQTLSRNPDPPQVWWMTLGAVSIEASESASVALGPLWGLGRTAKREMQQRVVLIDIDTDTDPALALRREVGSGGDETEVAWRTDRRFGSNLRRVPPTPGIPEGENYALRASSEATFDGLALVAADRLEPGAKEVEIEVRASGMNFRDVLGALGVYPGGTELGGECAGVIVGVGSEVDELKIGDRVMALAKGAYGRYVTADRRLVCPIPEDLSFAQGATVPVAFVTAWYALNDLAGLEEGEVVLIHAAAGGVGMAAVQIAQLLGAEVVATASSPKWETVRQLGVSEVWNSRDANFAEDIRQEGRRVDVVLDALTGELVDAGLSVLGPGGRFIEMGKTDIRDPDEVASAYPGVTYRAFDVWEAGPDRIAAILGAVAAALSEGGLRALPVRSFPITRAEGAFRFMSQARHVGKLALVPPRTAWPTDGTVLVTGGLGALGSHVARWLAEDGVPHLVLAGRRGAGTPGARDLVAELEALGTRVTLVAMDVADPDAVREVLARIPEDLPLRGVVHAAGVLDDGVLTALTADRLASVMESKLVGAWNLHALTAGADLDQFVLFSSIAGTIGSAGQANYAAANAGLDALAALRRSQGLVAQSLAWGPWDGLGMAEDLRPGRIRGFSIAGARVAMDAAVHRPEALLAPVVMDRSLGERRPAAAPPVDARAFESAIRTEVSRALSLPDPWAVPADQPLEELGMDSLSAIELRNALGRVVGRTLPAALAFDHPSIGALIVYLLPQEGGAAAVSRPSATPPRSRVSDEPIAIVGMACRFPGGATTPEAFWELLRDGVDAITGVPADRWDAEAIYDPTPGTAGRTYTRSGGFLEDIAGFDPAFFGISPAEAQALDPQQRLLLEVTWEALERAAQPPRGLTGSATGVYVGIIGGEYGLRVSGDGAPFALSGNDPAFAAGRLSHALGLRGPSLSVNTACSSSLVALHLACSALRGGECELALAGGVNALVSAWSTVLLSQIQALSPDGRCRTFDAGANGYGRGEGCGMLVLRRLSDAVARGDRIVAVVRGSAVNHDGRGGLTTPSGAAQQAVIRAALDIAGLPPTAVGYLECHGSATPLGDPIEVRAGGEVYGEGRRAEQPLMIGSVKANIGHLEGAAGVAGVFKAILALQHESVPPQLFCEEVNSAVPLDEYPLEIRTEGVEWRRGDTPRVAAVSSFGLSGTNAHMLVEEAPLAAQPTASAGDELLVLSGWDRTALEAVVQSVAEVLEGGVSLADLCYTAATGRTHLRERLALVASDAGAARRALLAWLEGAQPPELVAGRVEPNPRLVFVLSAALSPSDGGALVEQFSALGVKAEALAVEPGHQGSYVGGDLPVSTVEELTASGYRSFVQLDSAVLATAGRLFVAGAELHFDQLTSGRKILLPTYPFQRKRYWLDAGAALDFRVDTLPTEPTALYRELMGLKPQDRLEVLSDAVRMVATEALGRQVDASDTFMEVGMDSVMAVELAGRFQRALGVRLPATVAINYPTLETMSRYLLGHLGLAESARADAAVRRQSDEPIAIVGLACRYPGGGGTEGFWDLLSEGRDALREVPADRWDVDAWYDPEPGEPGHMYVRHASMLDDLSRFDAGFFRMSSSEAVALDPQQRLLLELSWDALLSAGLEPGSLGGSATGVFVGISNSEYGLRFSMEDEGAAYGLSGNDPAFAAGRVSHALGLRGPALSVNTACSSSLVALHQACAALRAGECELALASGVNALLAPETMVLLCQIRALAPDGRSKPFSARADGYGRGEGGGVVVLRRLSEAVGRGEPVLALVRGSAVNHDGRSGGLTVPNGPAQQEVIRAALQSAGVTPADVGYLECHGTGTPLGDPIEVWAAGEVYGEGRTTPLRLGAVKANIGHLEAGAGMAGLVKLVLALQHEEIPATPGIGEVNPELPLGRFPLSLTTGAVPWPRSGGRRLGAVSSFGLSGTNAHVILEEAPAAQAEITAQVRPRVWERRRYWREITDLPKGVATGHPLLGVRVPRAGADAAFESLLSVERVPWLDHHRVHGRVVLPAAAIVEVARAAAGKYLESRDVELLDLEISAPIALPDDGDLRLQVVLDQSDGPAIRIFGQPEGSDSWTLHAACRYQPAAGTVPEPVDLGAVRARCEEASVDRAYAAFAATGLEYGAAFETMTALYSAERESLAEVAVPPGLFERELGLAPGLLDGAQQALVAVLGAEDNATVPIGFARFRLYHSNRIAGVAHVELIERMPAGNRANVRLLDADGVVVAELLGMRTGRSRADPAGDGMFALRWQESALPRGEASSEGRWAVLCDDVAIRESVAAGLRFSGVSCDILTLDSIGKMPEVDHVVGVWTAERSPAEGMGVAVEGLALLQAAASSPTPPRLWMALRHDSLGSSPLIGLSRSAAHELPELQCTLLHFESGGHLADLLLAEAAVDDEREVSWLDGKRRVRRLERAAVHAVPEGDNYRLVHGADNTADGLHLAPASRRAPEPHQVELEVGSTGLNFRDVLNALGMYPGQPPLGGECSGVVVGVGEAVTDVAVGDAVMAIAPGSFSQFVTLDARLVAPVPEGLDLEQAAATPMAFLTAWYALRDVANLQAGERVVIHAASGGVGMAAVQIARLIGAEVLATASPPKWDTVRELGVAQVASSRNLDFAREFQLSGGADVVLNSLSGEFIDAGMSLLSPGGRFVELGKADVRDPAEMAASHPGVGYRAIDLAEAGPDRIAVLFGLVSKALGTGELTALPVRRFPLSRATDAFRFMAQAKHTGKLVLTPAVRGFPIRVDGTVLVTGGLGALGAEVARWLAVNGVAEVMLLSRRGMETEGASELSRELEDLGTRVTVRAVDVADRDALAEVIGDIDPSRPLRGVMHAAGVLDDGVFAQQTPERLAAVLRPKLLGAWNLHELTLDADLDAFVLFSSITGAFGGAGQGTYAAANTFLDALAEHRQARGLCALSAAWGSWAGAGMTGSLAEGQQKRLRDLGLAPHSRERGIRWLETALTTPAAHLVLARLNPSVMGAASNMPMLRGFVRSSSVERAGQWAQSLAGLPDGSRPGAVRDVVRALAADLLSIDAASISDDQPMLELGLDSLMVVELRNVLARKIGSRLPATTAIDYPTVNALSAYLLEHLGLVEPVRVAPEIRQASDEPIAIVGMSCRFPGGGGTEGFWRVLDEGLDTLSDIPADRWDREWFDPTPGEPGRMYVRQASLLGDLAGFDAGFFRMPKSEAIALDPQQRLLLELSWEALEAAGLSPGDLGGSATGVFVGIANSDFGSRFSLTDDGAAYGLSGNALSFAAGRISNFLGLRGPAVAVDTACSSSLVALHQACAALRAGECDMALAGGVNALVSPEPMVLLCQIRALALDGRSKPFSARADGYGRGEGCGVVVLRRLSEAVKRGERVLALVRGSAVNHDGQSGGLTVPSGPAQQEVIRSALRAAGVSPAEVDYLECHGTGTSLGDPIEVRAAGAVYSEGRTQPLLLGAVKANIGHLEAGAGVAGLVKLVLALQHEEIPATPGIGEVNPELPLGEFPLSLTASAVPWPRSAGRRLGAVSSFGLSGTNAHVIVEEAPDPAPPVAVPTHIWQRQRLWPAAPATVSNLDDLAFKLVWDVATPARARGDLPGDWLIVGDDGAFATDLVDAIRASGQGASWVLPNAAADAIGAASRGVVYIGALGADVADLSNAKVKAAIAPMAIAQVCSRTRLWLITRGGQPSEAGQVSICQGMLWGFGRALMLERPELRPTLVDLDPARSPNAKALAEILLSDSEDQQSLLRDGRMLVPHLEPVENPTSEALIRGDASYLIVGGRGEVGLWMARWLADRGARQLVITGRGRALDESALESLQALGVDALYIQCDAANRADVNRMMARIDGELAPLRGVIHAAGVLDDGLLHDQTAERFGAVLLPKVDGSWNLHLATEERDLDFFLLLSSAAAVIGSPGQTNYAAANGFLETLAHHRQLQGLPATCISWGPWELGMASRLDPLLKERMKEVGLNLITSSQASAAMDALLGVPSAVVISHDWGDRAPEEVPALFRPRFTDDAGLPLLQQLVIGRPSEEWPDLVAGFVRERLASHLPNADLDPSAQLWEQGMDSLMTIELRNELYRAGVGLRLVRMIAGPSIDEITRMAVAELAADPRLTGPVVSAVPEVDEEFPPLAPVASHLVAAAGGGIAMACVAFVLWQIFG